MIAGAMDQSGQVRQGIVTLPQRDLAGAVRFYVERLGMKVAELKPNDLSPTEVLIDVGDEFFLRLANDPATTPSANVQAILRVRDFEGSCSIYDNRGIKLTPVEGGKRVEFTDPEGNRLALAQA
jgi:catechol 2,3-dioxygenase-like lactoylglutathione lyase family enzyme